MKNGLHQVADLRRPSVVLPLIGGDAGVLSRQSAASAVASEIRSSRVTPPICVRVVTRNPSARGAVQYELPARGSEILNRGYSDPLEEKISAHLERVDQSGSPSRFDPYSSNISEYNDR